MKKIIFFLCLCFISTVCFAFCEHGVIITGNNGIQYCRSPGDTITKGKQVILDWYQAMAWCQAQGMHLVSVHELCDTNDAVWDEQMGTGKCLNFLNSGLPNQHVWASTARGSNSAYNIFLNNGYIREKNFVSANPSRYADGPFAMCR